MAYWPGNKTMRKNSISHSGMTILELLVVIAVFGMFMAIAIPTVLKSMTAMGRVKNSTAVYPNATRALSHICDNLRQAYAGGETAGEFAVKNSSYEAGGLKFPSDEINFPLMDSQYASLGSVQRMSYKLELSPTPNDSLRGLVQTRSPIGAPAEAGIRESLLREAIGFDVRYLDDSQVPPEWVQQWPPEKSVAEAAASSPSAKAEEPAVVSDPLPAAVEVTIYVVGKISRQPTPFRMVVNLPAAQTEY
jgi:prepilin-type N-terminal cleavage/methylation domain-containing protein